MKFLSLTPTTGESFLIRADLVLQVRPHQDSYSTIWFPTGTVQVKESVDEIRGLLEDY
jgi:hypothetical protein